MAAIRTALTLGAFAASQIQAQYPPPGPCDGWCSGSVRDPAIAVAPDGILYRFTSDDGLVIASAPSIAGPWQEGGAIFPKGPHDGPRSW